MEEEQLPAPVKYEYYAFLIYPGYTFLEAINNLGEKGWDLVCCTTENKFIFKRIKTKIIQDENI